MMHASSICSRIAAAAFLLAVTGLFSFAVNQESLPRERLHGVLSHARLSPPLRGPARQVRFSPDGTLVLIQNESGVLVLSREPIAFRLYVRARDVLPARFTADSKTLVIASHFLQVERWDVLSGKETQEKKLDAPDGCLTAELSVDGELAACHDPEFKLRLFRTATGEQLFSERLGPKEIDTPIMWPRAIGSAFAEPVGFGYSKTLQPLVGRAEFGVSLAFSPDGHYLMAEDSRGEALAMDTTTGKRINVPGSAKRRTGGTLCFAGTDRLAILDGDNPEDSKLISFPAGESLSRLPVAGPRAVLASNPRYLIVHPPGQHGSAILDLNTRVVTNIASSGAADILNGLSASVLEEGELVFSRLDKREVSTRFPLPLDPLPPLRSASVSPGLEGLEMGVRGASAVYSAASGQLVARDINPAGSWWSDDSTAYLRSYSRGEAMPVQKLDLKTATRIEAWRYERKRNSNRIFPAAYNSGAVVLEESPALLYFKTRAGITSVVETMGHHQLRALDYRTGKMLWSRTSDGHFPVPFPDPQGDRLVLGWQAQSGAAGQAVKRNPETARRFKSAKLSEQDTVFEVLDGATGNTLGGVLVQIGAGAESFSCVFSAGDSLVLGKDGTRITLYSLSTGKEKARLFGACPAANARSNLLASANGERLNLFDLTTGAKRDEFVFSDAVIYSHFSADGKRLLVLTAHQVVYILDVSGAAQTPAGAKP